MNEVIEKIKYTDEEFENLVNGWHGGDDDMYLFNRMFRNVLLTGGAKFVVDNGGKDNGTAHWLPEAIASWLTRRSVRCEPFQVWTLEKRFKKETKADKMYREHNDIKNAPIEWLLKATDGGKGGEGSEKVIARQVIPFSDFRLDSVKFYMEWGSADGVHGQWIIMLPSER